MCSIVIYEEYEVARSKNVFLVVGVTEKRLSYNVDADNFFIASFFFAFFFDVL